MPSLPRLATVLAAILVLAWFLPDVFRRATMPERVRVSAYYSAPAGQFLIRTDSFDKALYRDEAGNAMTAEAHRRLLPLLYYSDLAKHGQFPAEVAGVPVTPEQARREMQVLQLNPRDWNAPAVNLHTLFESAPWGTRLSLPDDMFRVERAGLSFLRAADGSVLAEKSRRFTQAMDQAGIAWPLAAIGGNPSPLKEFDEGYLLVDAAGKLFQLRMVRGEPDCRFTGLTIPGRVRAVVVDEHARREILGAVVIDNSVLLVTYGDALVRLPIPDFDADTMSAGLRSDPLNRTVVSADLRDRLRHPSRLVATGPDYRPMRRYDLALPADYAAHIGRMRELSSVLFPVSLVQFVPEEGRVVFRLVPASNPALAVLGCVLSAALLWAWRRRRGGRMDAAGLAVALLTGLPGLLAVAVFGPLAPPGRGKVPAEMR